MLTLWPPGPLEQNVSIRRSLSLICDVDLFGLRQDRHGGGRRVHASLRLGGRHALHAVHAALVLQLAVGAAPLDRGDDFLQAADAGLVAREHVELPALTFRVLAVHAEQLGGEQRRLVAARAGADLEHDVLLIVRILGDEQDLELGQEAVAARHERLELLVRQVAHVGVAAGGQFLRLRDFLGHRLVFPERLDDRLDLRQRLRVLPVGGRIALHLGRCRGAASASRTAAR